jgi:hypothetical protein
MAYRGRVMDRRNSKNQMLKEIYRLTNKVEQVYEAGRTGIAYVGQANYADRESEALSRLREAYDIEE